jgi:hypothetical protein
MKRAILLLVVVVGGAFYLGWFTFTTDNSGQTEHVNIVINKEKVQQDEARALDKLHAYEQQAESRAATAGQSSSSEQPTVARRAAPEPGPSAYQTTQPGVYPTSPIEPPSAGNDPYEVSAPPQPAERPAAEPADSFSRGFQ